jgi:catechol 2,3-dioxygenase-like lactoylglutathione lyase family enzyme
MIGTLMVVATIPVSDLDRGREFYEGKLGLEVLWDSPASIRFACGGGSELSIFRRPSTETVHTLAHFEVRDIRAAIAELESRGVEFIDYDDGPLKTAGHIAQIGPALGAWFHDPDGNTLGLREAQST